MPLNIPIFFPQLYQIFGIEDYATQMVVQFFLFVCLINIVFRIVLWIGYRMIYSTYLLQSKELKAKEDIKLIKFGFFSKVVASYTKMSERSSANINARDIVERDLTKTSILFINYSSIEQAVEAFEKSFMLIGFMLAVLMGGSVPVATVTIAAYAVIILASVLFNYKVTRNKIVFEMSTYIDGEIGRFYPKDSLSAINVLRVEIKNVMTNQSKILSENIIKLSADLSDVIGRSMKTMTQNIESTMAGVMNSADILNEPLNNWKGVVVEAAKTQTELNRTMSAVSSAVDNIGKLTTIIDGGFSALTDKMGEYFALTTQKTAGYFDDITSSVDKLTASAETLKAGSVEYALKNNELEEQLKYIKTNQQALEQSLQQYEMTLREMTTQMGEGLGRIVDFHLQETYDSINNELQENLKAAQNVNNEFTSRLQQLFEQLREQSQSETSAILSLKEQMDINFEMLNKNENR